jgi:hypothetical protein
MLLCIVMDSLIVVDEFEFCAQADDELNDNCAVRASAKTKTAKPVRLVIISFSSWKGRARLAKRQRAGDSNERMQQFLSYIKKRLRVNSQHDDSNNGHHERRAQPR